MTYRKQYDTAGRTHTPLPASRTRTAPPAARPAAQPVAQMAARIGGQPAEIQAEAPARPNRTGLPDALKNNIESLSGLAMDDVRVHRGSARPARLAALAFTQGSDIHLGPGQERHLPHEAWHAVQQKQGRVPPRLQRGGTAINDDAGLEAEADTMGALAGRLAPQPAQMVAPAAAPAAPAGAVAQCIEVDVTRDQKLIKDTKSGKLGGTKFEWKSKFEVTIQNDKVVVTIRIAAAIDATLFQEVWANQVAKQWSNRFMLQFDGKNYPIVVDLVQVTQGAHYPITVSNAESALGSGSRGHFGTENMTTWGKHDTTNISHEVGHMLGNVDEYGLIEVDGKERDYLTNPSTTIMGVSKNNPVAEHYYLIQWAAEQELNKGRKKVTTGQVLPNVERLGGMVSQGSALSMQELLGTKLKSTKSVAPQPSPLLDSTPKSGTPVIGKAPLKSTPKSSKDLSAPESLAPRTNASLKAVVKPSKQEDTEPTELEKILAKRRLRDTASSIPLVEPQRSTPQQGGSQVKTPQPLGPTASKLTPQVVPQIQAPKLVVPQAKAPEPEPEPQPEVTDAVLQRGRDLINDYYQQALAYVPEYDDETAMTEIITNGFKKIAIAYNAADPDAEDYVETLQAWVRAAKNAVQRLADSSDASDK